MVVNPEGQVGAIGSSKDKRNKTKNGDGTGMYEGHVLYLTRTTHSGHLLQPAVVYMFNRSKKNGKGVKK